MGSFELLADPLWVNLLILAPVASGIAWRKRRIPLSFAALAVLAGWGMAFGFVEAAVVVYLRALLAFSSGLPPGGLSLPLLGTGSITDPAAALRLPPELWAVEFLREAATIAMLLLVASLAAPGFRSRWAAFLWSFAIWDLAYYAFLRILTGWPRGLADRDVLFLIPAPWTAQVWFPLLVSLLSVAAVLYGVRRGRLGRNGGRG